MLQRRIIVENPLVYPSNNRGRFNKHQQPRMSWRPIEKRVKGSVVVEVNELPLPVPKYSFKIGTAKLDDNGQVIEVLPFLNVYNVHDAADLLREVGSKYADIRESKQEEMDANQRFVDEYHEHDGPLLPPTDVSKKNTR